MPVPGSPETEEPDPERIAAREDFARELTLLRLRAGLTVRQVAAKSDTFRNHSTIGDWFAGRGLPSTSSRELLVRVLAACGADDPALVARWLSAWQRVRLIPGRRPREPEPYGAWPVSSPSTRSGSSGVRR
ncbi:helix-turn-helix transcriptional regulator [Streptosporangium sp. NPDC048865]|uniref:helix-turn-helix transcriptional regulator n=1 Tax=Streptosporangium sp. NPDC048865 TaxID=3155766 RepID=UPI003449275A